jgi:hypothetical protein
VTLAHLPGSQATNIKRNLETIKAQGLMSWIASLKNSQGQTGIGRVLQSEANTAQALYGNMEQDQDAHQLKYHLQLFRRSVNSLLDHAETGFRTFYGRGTKDVMTGGQKDSATMSDQDLLNLYLKK